MISALIDVNVLKATEFVISRSGVLGVPWGKQFSEAHSGGWGFMENFIDDVKFRGFSAKVPSTMEKVQSYLQQGQG